MMSFITYQYCKVKTKLINLLNDDLDYDSDGQFVTLKRYEKLVTKCGILEKKCLNSIKKYRTSIYFVGQNLFHDTYIIEEDRTYEHSLNHL